MPLYRDHIYPFLVAGMGDPAPIRQIRRQIIPLARGTVLRSAWGRAPTCRIATHRTWTRSDAKATVKRILEQFGWEAADMGKAVAARAIEPLCQLWCIPGFLQNTWTHAFKVLWK